jgi:hypothetical protein
MTPITNPNRNADKLFRDPELVLLVVEFELPFVYLTLNISPDASEETNNLPLASNANPTGLHHISPKTPVHSKD